MRPMQPLLLAAVVMLSACAGISAYSARVPYSDRLLTDLGIPLEARPALQYYSSREIRLARVLVDGEAGVRRGRLVSDRHRRLEELVIDAGTPGVVVGHGEQWLAVSFAPGTYLYFVASPQRRGWLLDSDAVDGSYCLYSPNWRWDGTGTVLLGGDGKWQAMEPSRHACLLIDREALDSLEQRRKVLPGRWLYQGPDLGVRSPFEGRWRRED